MSDVTIIEAQQSKQIDFIYHPMRMTTVGQKHDASVFLQLPDGNGQFFQLIGIAEAPKPIQIPLKEVAAKTTHVEKIPVTNWMKKQQKFRVEIEITKPERAESGIYLKGKDYFDIGADESSAYVVELYCYRECQVAARITFRNQVTKEYLTYQVQFKVSQSTNATDNISLVTQVRKSVPYTLQLENPLSHPVTLTTETKLSEILLPSSFQIPAQAIGSCTFEFQPLKEGVTVGKLTFNSSDLGSYFYNLTLTAKAANSEPPTKFTTTLGRTQTKIVRFQNFAKQKTEYISRLESNQFTCDKNISTIQGASPNGTEATFEVHYEPVKIGSLKTNLVIQSPIGGRYTFPLVATCLPPKPQGPFTIRGKSQISIPFKNVFFEATEFALQTDEPSFTVLKQTELIKSKKVTL